MAIQVNPDTISKEINKTITDKYIELYQIDLSQFDADVFYFTTSYPKELGKVIRFNGIEYISLPIEVTGIEWNGDKPARPKMKLSAISPITASMITHYKDLVYSPVTRIRTFEKFLDDGETPDPSAMFQIDKFVIERKSKLSMFEVEFELASIIDLEGLKLPKRKVIKKYCDYVYRIYKNNKFIYDLYNPCPYMNENKFYTKEDVATSDPTEDKCSKTLKGCKARFVEEYGLPFQGFPGVELR